MCSVGIHNLKRLDICVDVMCVTHYTLQNYRLFKEKERSDIIKEGVCGVLQ